MGFSRHVPEISLLSQHRKIKAGYTPPHRSSRDTHTHTVKPTHTYPPHALISRRNTYYLQFKKGSVYEESQLAVP